MTGLRGGSPSLVVSGIAASGRNCCVIVPDEHQVPLAEQDLKLFSPSRVISFPGYEIPPYTPLSPDQQTTAALLAGLYLLESATEPCIVVASIEALMRRVIPKNLLSNLAELVMAENECEHERLIQSLDRLGYERTSLVKSVGDYSVRGGIIDIFPPPFPYQADIVEAPIRLDFFGDTVESIRCFDPVSQRSYRELEEAFLLPVHDVIFPDEKKLEETISYFIRLADENQWDEELVGRLEEQLASRQHFTGIEFFLPLFYRSCSSIFDYLAEDTALFFYDRQAARQTVSLVEERIEANYREARQHNRPALPPDELFLSGGQLEENFLHFGQIHCGGFPAPGQQEMPCNTQDHQLLKQNISMQRRQHGLLAPLTDQILDWQRQDQQVVICCRSPKRTKNLAELLARFHHNVRLIGPPVNAGAVRHIPSGELLLCDYPLSGGFSLPSENIHFLSESELFGEMRLGGASKKGRRVKGEPVRFAELKEGDIVVHRDHGLGLYLGLSAMEIQGVKNDFMLLEYRDGDKLYLPVDRLNLISRYEGLSDQQPRIDKLGSQNWKNVKNKVKEEVWKVAQELLDIYARREMQQGRQFSPPASLYHELEESFPYDETPGQLKAINDTIDDLTSAKSTDRLICGDVGYGKTEVAVRAAFKVVEDGGQVAVLVPTTVLSEQHAKTFIDRLQGFPVKIACINRFRSSSEQKKIIRELAAGEINIIIGTHRLLSKDIVYQDLGLLIVDEEHRFGVAHKEKIKKIKADVDILTLTATPIPRTLQMSLLGIRDLSVISTPPEHRRPVKTFVAQYDDLVIKEAVLKEMHRGGQVFFVHNRVKSIHQMAARIQKLVPEARLAVAHGQMTGSELEEIMVSFVNKNIDVLLCTTIIESGLDIPTANTIIIDRADRLGMAEIYQLRGRVGRSNLQSYAYLLVPSLEALSKDSRERLRALMDCSELGGGFKLAMSDLQIRGGGNLLGISQSGNIAAIGYDLYLDLLQKTVLELKAGGGERPSEEIEPEINLQIPAYIPEDYIQDVSQRYMIYRRISALSALPAAEHDELADELEDRFGPLPAETNNLFAVVGLKRKMIRLGMGKLERGAGNLIFSFTANTAVAPAKLTAWLEQKNTGSKPELRLVPDGRLVVNTKATTTEGILMAVSAILDELAALVS